VVNPRLRSRPPTTIRAAVASGLIFTSKDRAGSGVISSRLGLQSAAIEVDPGLDLHKLVVERLSLGDRIDYIICDEAQFYQEEQIEQLAKIVDGLGIDVFAFGILADFRTNYFQDRLDW
jgi:thymidine kinase